MWDLFCGFVADLGGNMIESVLVQYEKKARNFSHMALQIENYNALDSGILNNDKVTMLFDILYAFMIVLLALKLVWKGYNVYVLWRDGESEMPPTEMLVGALLAVGTAVAFPVLYSIAAKAIMELAEQLCMVIRFFPPENEWTDVIGWVGTTCQSGFASAMLTSVLLILQTTMFVKLLAQGIEILVWRLGVPIACVGLIDSDGGVLKPYMQIMFQLMATVLIEWFLVMLAGNLIAEQTVMGIALATGCVSVALNTPTILNRFLLANGRHGGGGMQKLYMLGTLARTFWR